MKNFRGSWNGGLLVAGKHHGHANPIQPVSDSFKLVAEARRQAIAIAETARDAVKNFYRDPHDLAAFIERHGTPVIVVPNALFGNFCLWLLGFEPGFIPPCPGRRYRLLQKVLSFQFHQQGNQGKKPGCHDEHGVFVLTRPLFTVGFLSHQLHHWLAYRSGLAGYTPRSQELYKKFWSERNGVIGPEVYDMTLDDMAALKSAISRDLEALVFLKAVASEILIPAKQAGRIARGTASA